jgi:hypothetical protein
MSTKSSADSSSVASSKNYSTSTAATLVASKSDVSSSTAVQSLAVTDDIQGAVKIGSATATNIAVDGSTVNSTTNYAVTLADAAEANAKALNIVNAAGGMVSNGVNTAHRTNLGANPTLNQVNTISQVR